MNEYDYLRMRTVTKKYCVTMGELIFNNFKTRRHGNHARHT